MLHRHLTNDDRKDAVQSLITRFVTGEISQVVFEVSLRRWVDVDEIKYLVALNLLAHRNSLAYRKGEVT